MQTVGVIVGYLAAICMVFGYLPQAISTIRTRDTKGIAVPTFLMMGLGSLFFIVQGIIENIWSLALANSFTFVCSVIIFAIKVHNDRLSHRLTVQPGIVRYHKDSGKNERRGNDALKTEHGQTHGTCD